VIEVPATAAARRTCYRKGCTHPECRAESNLYQKRLKADAIRGVSRRVPADKALRLLDMRERELGGVPSENALARALGISYRVIACLRKGETKYVEIGTYRKLLQPLGAPPTYVPPRATVLRVRALQAEGWRGLDLIEALGANSSLYSRSSKMFYTTAAKVVEFVASAEPGTSQQSATMARNKGWLPRSAYDQDLFLDPLWDGVGGLLSADAGTEAVVEDFFFLLETGVSIADALVRVNRSAEWGRKRMAELRQSA
jgi:transcriptional regulator with XRE-family HTH domain